jgi:hypothetical protein
LRVNNSALRFNPPGVEAAQGPGGFGAAAGDRVAQLAAELNLTSEQRKALEGAMGEMQEAMASMRSSFQGGGPGGPGGGGFGGFNNPRERMGQVRQRMTNQLTGVLSAEQLARFEQSFGVPDGGFAGGGFGGGPGGDPSTAGMRPGQVWVLEAGKPKSVRVLVGLSDSQFTEVRSQELEDGDPIILRLAR